MWALALLAGALIGTVQASFFEWAFHRYWLHRPWRPKECFTAHTLIHHQLCKFEDTFRVTNQEQEEALTFQWWAGPLLVALNVLPWGLLAWALSAARLSLPSGFFLVAMTVVIGLYYLGYEGLHYLMHKPRIGVIERSRYFRFIERHHRIHHVQMDKNLNVLLPVADFLLGTLVIEARVPATTPAGARTLARRHSKFGERLRRG